VHYPDTRPVAVTAQRFPRQIDRHAMAGVGCLDDESVGRTGLGHDRIVTEHYVADQRITARAWDIESADVVAAQLCLGDHWQRHRQHRNPERRREEPPHSVSSKTRLKLGATPPRAPFAGT